MENLEFQLKQHLKAIRIAQKLSVADVAAKIGITVAQLYQYESENAKNRPLGMDLFWKWSIALGKKPNIILATFYERQFPRSHTSKATRLKRLRAKPFDQLTPDELKFLQENVKNE